MKTKRILLYFQVNEGQIEVDQAALTGESLPVTMYAGDSAKMGSTVTRGEVEGTVEVRRTSLMATSPVSVETPEIYLPCDVLTCMHACYDPHTLVCVDLRAWSCLSD